MNAIERLDAVIVGSGPAGVEAAVPWKLRGKRFVLFGTRNLSSKLELAPRVENYLGFPGITGAELRRRFSEHLENMGVDVTAERVVTVYPMGNYFSVATGVQAYEAAAVILCPGVLNGAEIPGEGEFLGRGVSYCATCDAPLYKAKNVAVLGFSREAIDEANFLAEIASKVFYIPCSGGTAGLAESVDVISSKPVEISGSAKVERLVLESRTLQTDCVFVLREAIAPSSLMPGLAVKDGFIAVDSDMRTNIPGCYAAGDCTGKPHQYMRAAGQGQTAALNAVAYLDSLKG